MTKLILGTANFGMAYGKSMRSDGLNLSAVEEILDTAAKHDIDIIDTAIGYGKTESILGSIGISKFKIISKVPKLRHVVNKENFLKKLVEESCERLGIEHLDGLLLHDPLDLDHAALEMVVEALEYVKEQGLVKKIGASLYSPHDINWNTVHWTPDILQVPLNVFDWRFHTTNFMNESIAKGVEVHTRSIFLKGLLLSGELSKNRFFDNWRDHFELFEQYIDSNGSKVHACVGHVNSFPEPTGCVVGASTGRQLEEIIKANSLTSKRAPDSLQLLDVEILDPRRWVLQK